MQYLRKQKYTIYNLNYLAYNRNVNNSSLETLYNVDMEMGQRSNYDNEDHQSKQTEDTYPLFYMGDLEETADDNSHKEASVTPDSNKENQEIMNEYTVTETEISTKTCFEKDSQIQTNPDDTSFLSEKRKNDRISFINFSGQHIYYAFHQTYLSPNAVYILVLDMTKGFDEKEPNNPHTVLAEFESWTYKGRLNKNENK